jgi:hypothetical protein
MFKVELPFDCDDGDREKTENILKQTMGIGCIFNEFESFQNIGLWVMDAPDSQN